MNAATVTSRRSRYHVYQQKDPTQPIGFANGRGSFRAYFLPRANATRSHATSATGADGRLLYPEQLYSCPKKSGKTTFAAIYAITIVVLFGGTYAEAICAANDREQAMGRVFAAIKRIVECSPLLQAEAKITADRIIIADAVINAIPTSYASAAGCNPVVSIFDELWAYGTERLRRLIDELVPPPTRRIACRLTVTYAGFTGESALLEELYRRGLQQPQLTPDLYAGDGILMFWSHGPIAPWQTDAWIAEMRRSLRPNQFLRMIENRFASAETSFIDMAAWDQCTDPSIGHMVADRLLPVWVGVDASVKHDFTALARCHLVATRSEGPFNRPSHYHADARPADRFCLATSSRRCAIGTSASIFVTFGTILSRWPHRANVCCVKGCP